MLSTKQNCEHRQLQESYIKQMQLFISLLLI